MSYLHERGVKGYATLNTLVFEDEMEQLEQLLRSIAQAGVDAVIVQVAACSHLSTVICAVITSRLALLRSSAADACNRSISPRYRFFCCTL